MDAVMGSNSALDRLKETISKLALSISDIARMSGKSTGTISQVLNGKYVRMALIMMLLEVQI